MGQQKFVVPYGFRLRGVEVAAEFDGGAFYREYEPVIESFPGMWDFVAADRPGVTVTHLTTPAGTLSVRHEVLPEMVAMGVEPYLREHLIKDEADYRTVETILERAEFVPQYEKLALRRRWSARTVTSCRWFTASLSSRCSWSTSAR